MKHFAFIPILILALTTVVQSQPVTLRPVCKLPSILGESSGLEITEDYTFWSHNDSGGDPEIYMFDSSGTYYRSMRLANAENVDWEELAQDDQGNFYIGDFGNNSNNRKDLRIYKIPNPLPMSTVETNAEIINFSYTDQTEFPPPADQLNYDMEAMIWHSGALYLFTKNRTNPFDGMVYVYKVPDTPGTYSVARIDSFNTGGTQMLTSWITAADISPDGTQLVLLSNGRAWLFSRFTDDSFFSGEKHELPFTAISQTEAVCFASNTELYITDELVGGIIGGMLYKIDLGSILGVEELPEPEGFLLNAYPNPFGDSLVLSRATTTAASNIMLYNAMGKCVYQSRLHGSESRLTPSYAAVPPGMYLAVVQTPDNILTKRVIRR